MRALIFTIYTIIFITSCIEPVDVNIKGDGSNILVVEGGISTQFGPHTIQLSRTAKYGSIFEGTIKQLGNAKVSIRDSDGQITFLEEQFEGVYRTNSTFKGEVGKSYSLLIETPEGTQYSSIPEEIVEVPQIDTIYSSFKKYPTLNPLQFQLGLEVFCEFKDDPDVDNNYLWIYEGTYQIKANPELHLDPETGGPDPLDCCSECWTSEIVRSPNILNDKTLNGQIITQRIGYIEDDGVRFGDKYHLSVSQLSLSPEAYAFYQLVDQQLSINGDIFDPPPATVRGNIIDLDNPNKNVIGFFYAADVKNKSIFLNSSQLIEKRSPTLIRGDCRNYTPKASTNEPDFWN